MFFPRREATIVKKIVEKKDIDHRGEFSRAMSCDEREVV